RMVAESTPPLLVGEDLLDREDDAAPIDGAGFAAGLGETVRLVLREGESVVAVPLDQRFGGPDRRDVDVRRAFGLGHGLTSRSGARPRRRFCTYPHTYLDSRDAPRRWRRGT